MARSDLRDWVPLALISRSLRPVLLVEGRLCDRAPRATGFFVVCPAKLAYERAPGIRAGDRDNDQNDDELPVDHS